MHRLLAVAVLSVLACSGRDDPGRDDTIGGVTTACGNGKLDTGEECDKGIADGVGACPTACDDGNACTTNARSGAKDKCTAKCVFKAITACTSGDGCCAPGCSESDDTDCAPGCGNGHLDPGEICDGNCATTCPAGAGCNLKKLTGSPAQCNVVCVDFEQTACKNGDSCCPEGCSNANDNDCQATNKCGNGIVDQGETCDKAIASGSGSCDFPCGASSGCSKTTVTGSASTCDFKCLPMMVTTCANNDSCCPTGCVRGNDNDCPVQGCTTCGINGDGCCPAGCTNAQDGDCTATTNSVWGTACTQNAQCSGGVCLTEVATGMTGGYCSKACSNNAACGAGAHCSIYSGQSSGSCVANCTAQGTCTRANYACFDTDGDGVDECEPTATGSGATGAPCVRTSDCSGGNLGYCEPEGRDWYAGYCSRLCDPSTPCPAGSHCSTGGICEKDCTSSSQCRSIGYRCYDLDGDGSTECMGAGTGGTPIGGACVGIWQCAAGEPAFCIDSWTDGYCTAVCGGSWPACPSGSACVDIADSGDTNCFKTCVNDGDCRSGFSCFTTTSGAKVCKG